jgi:uncharacterized protein YjbI with pentapeptide repeats
MADEALVRILKKSGAKGWNKWRAQNSHRKINLSGANLSSLNLINVDLYQANLKNANLSKTNLSNADLSQATLVGACLDHSHIEEADISNSDCSHAQLREIFVAETDLTQSSFRGADMSGSNLGGNVFTAADLTNANLSRADFSHADLAEARLRDASLMDTVFIDVDLKGTDFRGSHMDSTIFGDCDLSLTKGLDAVLHDGPSIIGIDAIYRSAGKIPESFLQGAGIPEDFIRYMKSLVSKPIEFYSCFISYSSRDHEFAERLHADLQSRAIRCWFAPEDLKIGDKFRARIEESIRLYDKLMVVLSESSIQSHWVEEEVEAALEKERQHAGITVLFPIRLDNAVMETKQAWAASLRRTRHIGEFNNWKNHDRYKKAFERLLRDLKAEAKSISLQE